jgi:hypothetical protein
MKYGLWDTKDKCWMGNGAKEKGPNLYDDPELARAGALVCGRMLEFPFGRIIAKPFEDSDLNYVGELQATHSADEVLADLMKGES